jgi:hypothetical protein
MKVNGREFNEAFCRRFTAEHLRKVYNGESVETLDALIDALYGKPEPVAEQPQAEQPETVKKSRKKKEA